MTHDTQLLKWARALQSLAQTGLHYTGSDYDRSRYRQLQDLAAEMIAYEAGVQPGAIKAILDQDTGPGTPKVDVRGVVFNDAGEILLVREANDGDRWTLPGGWADVNETPAETTVREVWEESGYHVRATKLLAVWDKTRHDHPPDIFYIYKVFFLCELLGGEARGSLETSEVAWFAEDALPTDLSEGRVTMAQLQRFFVHRREPDLPTDFD